MITKSICQLVKPPQEKLLLAAVLLGLASFLSAAEDKPVPAEVAVQPYGEVPAARIEVVRKGLEAAFGAKVAIHECGHVMGLPHCPAPGCVMADAEGTIDTVDGETGAFCEECRKGWKRWLDAKKEDLHIR